MQKWIAFGITASLLTGCSYFEKPEQKCWSPDAKQVLNKMVNETVTEQVFTLAQQGEKPLSEAEKSSLKGQIHLTIDQFSGVDVNKLGVVSCEADVHFTFSRDAKPPLEGHINGLEYRTQPGEAGMFYSIPNVGPIRLMVTNAKPSTPEKLAAPEPEQAPPAPVAPQQPQAEPATDASSAS
ncbi:hypothetical protein [Aquitalea denitrificans]|uniref:hypothetical protein n=1 Tax=Aquitalea denitrificans TaxID=519081 RepID=UPI001358823E|nr:hypothetical protein [Aquitalea denitrificans]